MNISLLLGLTENAELLLVLSIIYDVMFIRHRQHKKLRPVLAGLLIGTIGILTMTRAHCFQAGLIFDTRTILISVTALVFGPATTAIAVVMTSLFRLLSGGIGMLTGVASIVTSAAIGLAVRHHLAARRTSAEWWRLLLFGFAVSANMILCQLLLPWPTSVETIREIALPVLLIYPVVTFLLAVILVRQQEHGRTMRRITEAETRYRTLFENRHAPMMIVDPENGRILDANQTAAQFYGWPVDQMKTMKISDINTLDAAEIQQEMEKALLEQRNHFVFEHRRADGTIGPVEVYSGPIVIRDRKLLYSIIHDISERYHFEREKAQYEKRLRQQHKLEAIGTLASGIAHEINNPVFGIMNYAQLIKDDLAELMAVQPTAQPALQPADQPHPLTTTRTYIQGILDESHRVSGIVKSLLQFSRRDQHPLEPARLDEILNQTLTLARAILRNDGIEISLAIDADLPAIRCRPQEIRQVILNLITNARDALNEKYPTAHADKVIHIRCATDEKRGQVHIEVEDHGVGIPEAVQSRMFEPYFSTKPRDQGTGIGLAISFGIIQDHHGFIDVESEPGHYTIVRVHLPIDGSTRPA